MISEVMKEIARGCIDEKVSAAVAFGTVITAEPITIRVEERLVLDEGMLVIPEELKKRETEVQLGSEVKTITLSYTFFEVGGKTPAAPVAAVSNAPNEPRS